AAFAGSGARLVAGADISIIASSDNSASAQTLAAAGGLVGIGTTTSIALAEGSVRASMQGNVSSARDLIITADGKDTANAETTAAPGGILSGAGAVAKASVKPTIEAWTGSGTITTSG